MWLPRAVYDDLKEQLSSTTATRDALLRQVQGTEVTLDWFRVRITQLEHERALMMQNYLGITVPTMSIERVKPASSKPSYDPVPHFNDVGDEEAARIGIDWDPITSEVTYHTKD